jgi:hypothetical protein
LDDARAQTEFRLLADTSSTARVKGRHRRLPSVIATSLQSASDITDCIFMVSHSFVRKRVGKAKNDDESVLVRPAEDEASKL